MNTKLLAILAAASLLAACGSETTPEEGPSDPVVTPPDDSTETPTDPPSSPTEPPSNEPTTPEPDVNAEALQFAPDSYWASESGDKFILMKKDTSTLLTRNDAVAQILQGHLLWIFDPNGHEGFSQNYDVSCDAQSCMLSLSDYMETWDAAKKPEDEKIALKPSKESFVFPDTKVSTILSDIPSGKYYRGASGSYSPYTPNALPIGMTVDATLVIETEKWTQGFSFIEKLSESEYLVFANSSVDTPFPASNSQKNWFTTVKIQKGATTACSTCQCTEYTWAISNTWNNYRDPVKLHREYTTYSGSVFYVEPGSCLQSETAELPFTKITVEDEAKGNWDWQVTGKTTTPYDSRELKYLEVLDYDGQSWRALYTYAQVYKWDTSDPERFEFGRYFQIAKFTPSENGCYAIDVTDLKQNGIFGVDLSADMPMHFNACNPVKEEKPEPGKDPDPGVEPDPGTDPGGNPDPGTDPEPSEFLQSDFKSQRTTAEGVWTLWAKSDELTGTFNGEAFDMKILYKADNAYSTETSHAHYYLVEVQPGHKWYGLQAGMITAIELYFYEQSSNTPQPYLKFMYPEQFPTLTKDTKDFSSISFKKSLNNFMIE